MAGKRPVTRKRRGKTAKPVKTKRRGKKARSGKTSKLAIRKKSATMSRANGIEVTPPEAQDAHAFLLAGGLMDKTRRPVRSYSKIVFPTKKLSHAKMRELKDACKSARLVRKNFELRERGPSTLREALAKKLSKKEFKSLPSSFDLLGDCAIIEVPDELAGKENLLGKALMSVNKSVKSVFMKTGAHTGVFREEPVELVAGKKTRFATYREHGCIFRISMGKVFFSPRLSTERIRIARLIKPGEKVAALFAGVGPFPIVFAKHSAMEKAVAIELNPVAVEDMEQNIKANKVEDRVEAVLGDVKALSRDAVYAGQFDRAVMPLPKGGEDFLEDAIRYIKPSGGVVHYYQFVARNDPYTVPLKQIESACQRLGREFEVLFKRKVREYAPDIIQVVVDFGVCIRNPK